MQTTIITILVCLLGLAIYKGRLQIMVFWVTKEQLLAALSARALSSNVLQEYAVLKAENETLKSDNAALMTKLADQQPIIDIVTDATVVTAGTAAVAASGQ